MLKRILQVTMCVVLAVALFLPRPGVALALEEPWQSHWAFQALSEVISRGLVTGYPGGSLQPDRLCTRAEFSAMLVRFLGQEQEAKIHRRLEPFFVDLPLDHWAKGYMEILAEMGVLKGDSGNKAVPDKSITRQEAIVFLHRALATLGVPKAESQPMPFSDGGDIAPWAQDSFKELSALGIVLGDGSKAKPKDVLTRAEASALFVRAMDVCGKRFDLTGKVLEVNQDAQFMIVSSQGAEVSVRVDRSTLVFRRGQVETLGNVKQGEKVGIVIQEESGLAKIVCLVGP